MKKKIKAAYLIMAGLISLIALILQLYLSLAYSPESAFSYLQSIIKYFSFMTILTNILVALTYIIPLLRPNSRSGKFLARPMVQTGVLVYILIVFLIYHFILASIWDPQGLEKVADHLLHYFVPLFYLIFWLFFVEKGKQVYLNSIKWLVYPFIYVIYILIRGAITDMYPYPFLNVTQFGYGEVFKNIFLITIVYIIAGLIIVASDKLIAKISKA